MKETLEVIGAINAVSGFIKGVLEDGKIEVSDLFKATALKEAGEKAIQGLPEIANELKHLNGEQVEALVTAGAQAAGNLYDALCAVAEYIKSKKK